MRNLIFLFIGILFPVFPCYSIFIPKDTLKAWNYYLQAESYNEKGNYDSSSQAYLHAAIAYKKAGKFDRYLKNRILYYGAERNAGNIQGLEKVVIENLDFAVRKFGENHPLTADCYNNMGNLFDDANLSDSAIYYFKKTTGIRTVIYGRESNEVANSMINTGIVFNKKGLFDSALVYINLGLQSKIKMFGRNHADVAKCYNSLGVTSYYKGSFQEAERFFRESLEINIALYGDEHPLAANGYSNLGGALLSQGKSNDALAAHQQALEIRTRKLRPDHPNIALSYNNIGNVYADLGEYELSNQYHEKALEIRKRILPDQHNPAFAQSFTNLGINNLATGNCEKALDYFERAAEIEILVFGPDHPTTSDAYNNIGSAYQCLGQYDSSFVYFNKALVIRKKNDNLPGMAGSYNNIGACYKEQGDYDLAISYYQQSADLLKKAFDFDHVDLVSEYNNISEAFLLKKEFDRAYDYAQKAQDILFTVGDENNPGWISQLNLTAIVLKERGDSAGESALYKRAAEISKRVLGDPNFRLAGLYQNMALNYRERNRMDSSLYFIQKAMKVNRQFYPEKHPETAEMYKALAEIYHFSGKEDSSVFYCTKALESNYNGILSVENTDYSKIFDELLFLDVLTARSESQMALYRKNKDPKCLMQVMTDLKIASNLAFILLGNYNLDESKMLYVAELSGKYKEAVFAGFELYEITGDAKWLRDAFYFSEHTRAEVLEGSVIKTASLKRNNTPDSLLLKDRSLMRQISYMKNKFLNCCEDKGGNDSCYFLYARKSDSLSIELSNVRKQMADNQNPAGLTDYLSFSLIDQLSATLKPEQALLEYCIYDSILYAFVIGRNSFHGIKITGQEDLQEEVRAYIKAIRKFEPKGVTSHAHKLYKSLIVPIEKYLEDVAELIIIPDEQLLYLPFETLVSRETATDGIPDYRKVDYLIRNYAFTYHYSASLWEKQNRTHPDNLQFNTFGGFAPVFSPSDKLQALNPVNEKFLNNNGIDEMRSVSIDNHDLAELPFSKTEIDSISEIISGTGMKTYRFLYDHASEKNFKESAGTFDILHVATHGLINNKNPELSGLAFAQGDADSFSDTDDGVLYAGEIYLLSLPCDLVVLSACETGSGKLEKGEGVIGLTRSFLYAGARNLIFSYWKVGDKATLSLMTELYRNLAEGADYATSLRNAKMKLIQDQTTAYPSYWGAFALIGR